MALPWIFIDLKPNNVTMSEQSTHSSPEHSQPEGMASAFDGHNNQGLSAPPPDFNILAGEAVSDPLSEAPVQAFGLPKWMQQAG